MIGGIGQFDILVARIEFQNCDDLRPCLVVHPPKGGILEVAPISSQFSMFDESCDFLIENTHPDFHLTGLTRTSYVMARRLYDLDISDVKKRIGLFGKGIAWEFKDWYGL